MRGLGNEQLEEAGSGDVDERYERRLCVLHIRK